MFACLAMSYPNRKLAKRQLSQCPMSCFQSADVRHGVPIPVPKHGQEGAVQSPVHGAEAFQILPKEKETADHKADIDAPQQLV